METGSAQLQLSSRSHRVGALENLDPFLIDLPLVNGFELSAPTPKTVLNESERRSELRGSFGILRHSQKFNVIHF